ncbi:Zinc transporter 5 like [Actinidia chinensis var. chinensis]|uniref:Zinc transporter 5 like n=1 Tax=Actinidia chinensis var. chinensis TaxID=1590841 RepID=A0A2R6QH97_ACTCC|nr:Zinc transporter 5 like [Actinidia chinensis var. chinensis]
MTTMVMFYLGGKIIRDRREGISYDIDATVCYNVELRTSVAQLRDMIIPMIAEYGEYVTIKFICRYPHGRNGDVMIYKKLPINDGRTLQNILNIPSRDPNQQYVEIYVAKEEGSTINTSASHAVVSWADVHTYGELLSGRGDVSVLELFTQMASLGQSSGSTLEEEAPGQQMCSLFSQGECIEAGGAGGSVDPVERLVALGETGTQVNEDVDVVQSNNSDEDIDILMRNESIDDFDDDGHEEPNIGEALHDTPHIPFLTNLVGTDDVVGGRDLYDHCPTWSDVPPEFAKGMVFTDKYAVIRVYNWASGSAKVVTSATGMKGTTNMQCSSGPINGTVLTLQAHHRSTWIWEHGVWYRCAHMQTWRLRTAFGIIPPAEEIDSGRLRMSWLRHTFDVLPEHVNDISVQRHILGNPVHRPTSGYVEIGSTIEIATCYIAAIHDRIDRAIYAYDRPESLQDMYTARDMCSGSLNALREHQQIGQLGVPTIPLGVPAASHVTPTMPSYTYHISSHDVPSSSCLSSSGIKLRRTTHRHITSPGADRDTCLSRGDFTNYIGRVTATATTRATGRATAMQTRDTHMCLFTSTK